MNLFPLDIETTGFSSARHEAFEIAFAIMIDGVIWNKAELWARPTRWSAISKQALEVNKWTVERLRMLPEKKIAHTFLMNTLSSMKISVTKHDIEKKTDSGKFTIIEHTKNRKFDNVFLKMFMDEMSGNKLYSEFDVYFEKKIISTYDLAKQKLPNLESYSLANVARALGFPVDSMKLHGAAYDRDLMIWVYRTLGGAM